MILNPFNSANLFNPFGGNTVGAADILSLDPEAWYRYGVGITVTGAGVSTWADQSGNGRDLLQGTDTNRPALQADNSILFDGVDNYMATGAFTLAQPNTIYLLLKYPTYTATDAIFNALTSIFVMTQNPSSPQLRMNAGAALTNTTGMTVDTYGVLSYVFNGASSVLQVNNETPTTGDAGANDLTGGFNLGANSVPGNYSNIQVKEVILFGAAHDAPTRATVIKYLAIVGDLSI